MRKTPNSLIRIAVIAVMTGVLLSISACSKDTLSTAQASGASSLPSALVASTSPVTPPEVSYSVRTDYSQLTPYEPPEEIYTRLSESYMPQLLPSEDYGMLVPYVGQILQSDTWGAGYIKGLVTLDGQIVTDAVYCSIYSPSTYDSLSSGRTQRNVYILCKAVTFQTDKGEQVEKRYAICALDGRWVSPLDYVKVLTCDQVMLLFRDYETRDFDVMDYSGKILYNSKKLSCFSQLQDYTFYFPNGSMPIPFGSSEGYIALWNWEYDVPCAFLNEKTGDLVITEYTSTTGFSDGFAAVEKNGLWGYIDTDFKEVITPQYTYANDFENGKAAVTTTDNAPIVIDKNNQTTTAPKPEAQESALDTGFVKNEYMITLRAAGSYYLMTIDRGSIAPVSKNDEIVDVVTGPDDDLILIQTSYPYYTYKLIRSNGEKLLSGSGYISLNEQAGLIDVNDDDFFAYINIAGETIFKKNHSFDQPD